MFFLNQCGIFSLHSTVQKTQNITSLESSLKKKSCTLLKTLKHGHNYQPVFFFKFPVFLSTSSSNMSRRYDDRDSRDSRDRGDRYDNRDTRDNRTREEIQRGPAGNNDRRIYVGNLPHDIREKDVKDIFYRFGDIADVDLKANRTYGSPFAFVEFKDKL